MTVKQPIVVRRFREEDALATAALFHASVHGLANAHYSQAERDAWAPQIPETAVWMQRLQGQSVFVAERDGVIVGFMTLRPDGYLDLAFVSPDASRKGVASKLYEAIEAEAMALGLTRLHAQASHLARPFFERQGWTVLKEQSAERNGVALTNFAMERRLD